MAALAELLDRIEAGAGAAEQVPATDGQLRAVEVGTRPAGGPPRPARSRTPVPRPGPPPTLY